MKKSKNLKTHFSKSHENLHSALSKLKVQGDDQVYYCMCDGECPKYEGEDVCNDVEVQKISDIYQARSEEQTFVFTSYKKLSFDILKLNSPDITLIFMKDESQVEMQSVGFFAEFVDAEGTELFAMPDMEGGRGVFAIGTGLKAEIKVPYDEFYLGILGTLKDKVIKHKYSITLDFQKEVTLTFEAGDISTSEEITPIKDYTFDPQIIYRGKIKNLDEFGNALTAESSLITPTTTKKSSLSGGAIAGIVIACVVVVGAIVAVIIILLKKKGESKDNASV